MKAAPRARQWLKKGDAQRRAGKLVAAERAYRSAVAEDPASAEAAFRLGAVLARLGRADEARRQLDRATAADPGHVGALLELGRMAEAQGRADEALARYRAVATRHPDQAEAHLLLGRLLLARDATAEAVTHLRWAAERGPDEPRAHALLGLAQRRLGDLEASLASLDRALALDPADTTVAAAKAKTLELGGDYDAALDVVGPLVDAGCRDPEVATVFATLAARRGRAEAARALLEDLVRAPGLDPEVKAGLHHALGDLYAAAGEDDRAFAAHARGHEVRAGGFDADAFRRFIDDLVAAFAPERMRRLPHSANASRLPVFIVGMPRSGTTLAEQILASHPEAEGAGELPDIGLIAAGLARVLQVPRPYPACVDDLDRAVLDRLAEGYLDKLRGRFPAARRVSDKMPHNFLHLGLIALLFPGARIVHCVRDPLDNCLSCYFTTLSRAHDYATDLGTLGRYYREYRRLMAHWAAVLDVPMLELKYEDLVADQEAGSRALVEFAGLEWDERCLRFFETRRGVGTASYDQVRQPIYNRSVGRWRRYQKHLGPLIEALGDAVP